MFWNKIEVDNSNVVINDNNVYYMKIENNCKLDITVCTNITAKVVVIANSNYDINIKLNRESNLVVNSINKDNSVNVNVDLQEEASITYNHNVLDKINSVNSFTINHIGDNSKSYINNNGINVNNGKLFFTINGSISSKLKDVVCNQKSKIINYNLGSSKIIPNLIINSNDILANHSAYIGKIDDEIKFYMQSRGINENNIKKLIYQTMMLGTMDLNEEKEEFNKIINEWW